MTRQLSPCFYTKEYTNFRRNQVLLLFSAFNEHQEFLDMSNEAQDNIIKSIEESCYKETYGDEVHEELLCSSIYNNITKTNKVNNTYLFSAIINKEISLEQLPKMRPEDLAPGRFLEIRKKYNLLTNAKCSVKTTSLYKCRRCQNTKCTVMNIYNRALDEGNNIKIHCESCGLDWCG